ncbi:MAG: hypothetical protein ABIP11_05465 [Luteimonas sp.]
MNASVFFPSHLHWTSAELADAVPLRLHELFAFDAGCVSQFASNMDARRKPNRRDYLMASQLPPVFRVR